MTIDESQVALHQHQLAEITENVWSSFLTLPLSQVRPAADAGARSATATIHISGSWNGSVVISSSATLARRAAAAMFELEEDELGDGEVSDAFGELVNMIGGSVKSLLPEPSRLSLPTVSHGAAHVVTVPGAGLVEQVELDCDGERVHVAVWKQS